jgi:hypothetical protein
LEKTSWFPTNRALSFSELRDEERLPLLVLVGVLTVSALSVPVLKDGVPIWKRNFPLSGKELIKLVVCWAVRIICVLKDRQ